MMTRLIRFHLFLMLACAVAAPALSQTQGGADILLAKARSLEARGRIDLAAENWRKVLLVNPNQTEALAGLARAAKENGQPKEERSYLDRLRHVNPHDPGIAEVEKLRVFTPAERKQLDEAGRLAMQHKPDQAMKIYHQVLGDQLPPPGKWAQPFYETEAASTGGREKAIAQLRRLCAENPKQGAYRMWLASLLTYDPKTRMEGLQLFESIKDLDISQQARAPWRQALLWEKNNPAVLAPMEAYLQRYPDPELQPIVAALQAKQQQNIADADKAQAFKALRNQNAQAAAARFNEVLAKSPNDIDALVGLGYAQLDQKNFSAALSLFDHARTLAPQRQDVRDGYNNATFWLAMQRGAAAQQSQPEAAVQAYQQALTLRPLDSGALLGLANVLVRERKFADAEVRFQQVLNQDPKNADALAGLGFVRINEKKFDDAAKLLGEAHALEPARKDVEQGYQNAKFWGIMNQATGALDQHRAKDAMAEYRQALSLNPNDHDALVGLAHASDRAGDFETAAKTYSELTSANSKDVSSWLGLIQAQVHEKAPQAAISTSQRIPPTVKLQMESRSDYLSEMAFIYYETNQTLKGDQTLRLALQTASKSDTDDALAMRLQIAGDFMDQGKVLRAIEIYSQATQSHPNNPSGWEGLIGAYTRLREFDQAVAAVRSMPQLSYKAAVKHTGFLDSVATLYSARGQCGEAEDLLQRSLALEQSVGHAPEEATQLQLADVWMREHNYGPARDLYRTIITRDANSTAAWRSYLALLHQQRADQILVAEIPRMPPAVRTQLETDPSFLVLEASAYSSEGQNQDAVRLLQQARSRYSVGRKPVPVVLDIQTAWTMLTVSVDAPGLNSLLSDDLKRTDLTSKEHDAIEEIYSTWSVRRAERAFTTKPQLAYSILTDAEHEYPGDRNIHVALASLYLKGHDKEKALEVFQTWGMRGAQAGDYRLAAGAALSAHKEELATQYLRRGLKLFPSDPELMHMMARQDIAAGNYGEGERELKSALLSVREQDSQAAGAEALPLPNPAVKAESGSAFSTHEGESARPGDAAASTQTLPPCKPEPAPGTANEARIRPASLVLSISQTQNADSQQANGQASQQAPSQPPAQRQQQEEQMQAEVEALDNRNTPVVNTGGIGSGRIGDPGFDQLIVGDTFLGGAYTASNRVRLGIEAHGVYAYSGTPDGSSTLRFGTLPQGALFAEQSKIGYAGVAQLSTKTFGMAFGTSPQGFAVHNLTGGIRYRPRNGWFTLSAVRDSIKDSLLSYAGSYDPGSGLRWGGVVANTGTVKFDNTVPNNTAHYRLIGTYASASYSFIQGLHVPNNSSFSGNAGLNWQVVQGLTVGVSATAMHYRKNLSYFSFGQGGYFSPQQYYLGTIPITWYSRHPRFEYEVRFSGGVQYLHEDASPFYPTLPSTVKVIQGVYAANNSAAPNYDASIRMGYRVAPHVYLDAFATANNSRNYYTQSAGFTLRFMLDRIPTSTDLRVNSIPDWTGQQPFSAQ